MFSTKVVHVFRKTRTRFYRIIRQKTRTNIEIDKPVSKLDIKPTLAYLCNIEDGFSLGTNMFASKTFVSLNNERIISYKYYYDGEWYERQTGKMINLEEQDEDTKKLLENYYQNMKRELEISNSISVNNLLNK